MAAQKAKTLLLAVIAISAGIWLLRESYAVTMPLIAACFIAAVIWPVYRWAARRSKLTCWLALPISMAAALAIVAMFLGIVITITTLASDHAQEYAVALESLWLRVTQWLSSRGVPVQNWKSMGTTRAANWALQWLTYGVGSLWGFGASLVLTFFFTLFILLESGRWSRKTNNALGHGTAVQLLEIVRTTSAKIRQYLLTQSMIGVLSGAAQGLYLWMMGVDLALAWALVFFVFNYIPNIGSIVSMIGPFLITLATAGIGWATTVLIGMVAIETVMGNLVAPFWQAKNLSISPLVVLLSVAFWAWLWGPVGAVLAVPLTASILIACSHVESLRGLALLMSDSSNNAELDRRMSTTPLT